MGLPDSRPRILCVDDEANVVEGLRVALRKRFDIRTATSGVQGLREISQGGRFAAIVSDLRMPHMDGTTFLAQARKLAPTTVRLLLTGNADLEKAIEAVNEGNIFRLLLKPCPLPTLSAALDAAVEHHGQLAATGLAVENELAKVRTDLIRADRLATLGTIAGGVGHEIKNSVAIMKCLLQFVGDRVKKGELPLESDLEELAKAADHLHEHATHLMDLGRPDDIGETFVDLKDAVIDAISLLRASKLRNVEVELDFAEKGALVRARRISMEQVFINLLGNAADALAQSKSRPGRIRVGMHLATGAEQPVVFCEVEDNGCGIPQDRLASVFAPYYTTKPRGQGTGLGLSVVKQIIETAGGTIKVESREGEGSTFSFELPVAVASGGRQRS
ncbi:MAG: ATP-binding protein [Pseudomonadota bacterium]